MHNLGDDNELDDISRQAAGQYAPTLRPDWDAMQQLLDEVMPVKEKKRRFVFWWLLPLFLFCGAGAYWFLYRNAPAAANKTAVKNPAADTHSQPPPALLTNGTPVSTSSAGTIPAAINNRANTWASAGESTPALQDATTTIHTPQYKPAASSNSATFVAQRNRQETTQVPVTHPDSISSTTLTEAAQQTTVALQTAPEEEKKTVVQGTNTTTDSSSTANATIQQKPRRQAAFSFGLLAGADESTVKFRYGNQAGINMGLMAGYHFGQRWSVHTGVIYTQKNYKMAGQDFAAPKGSIISYYKLETVDGYCRMWEVPLLARYTINPSARNTVFLSTGLSSYFMTKENYNYFYYYNNQPVTRNYSYNSDDTHLLSIWHISAGFDKPIGGHLSLQVEPYAKLPLGGVGLGSIRLSSFGINFSVQYRQPAKKQ